MKTKKFERDGQQVLVRKGQHEGRPALLVTIDLDDALVATTHMSVNDASLVHQMFDNMAEEGAFFCADKMRQDVFRIMPGKGLLEPVPFARLFDLDGGQVLVLKETNDDGDLVIQVIQGKDWPTTLREGAYPDHEKRDRSFAAVFTSAEAAVAWASIFEAQVG